MMSWLKNRMHKKDYDDLEDIRSNVLGNDFLKNPEPDFPRPSTSDFPSRSYERRNAGFQPGFDEFSEPPGFSSIDTRFQGRNEDKNNNYDIIDRLNLIESQLAAIRSQTETINERLKNLETKLTRRY